MSHHAVCFADTQIIIFAREPMAGQVKTRLVPALGEQGAKDFYTVLLDITLQKLSKASLADMNVCITPESREAYFLERYYNMRFQISQQEGQDLGIRMFNALKQSLKDYPKAVLIGTDCPFLNPDDLQQAIKALDSNDMVFIPAIDGGYVLVGARRTDIACFKSIDWSTERVMQQTREQLSRANISWRELTPQRDIDTSADLDYLSEHIHKFSQTLLPVVNILKRYS